MSSEREDDVESVVAECNDLILQLRKCVDESGPFKRAVMGSCNKLSVQVEKCKTRVWKANQKESFRQSEEKKKNRNIS